MAEKKNRFIGFYCLPAQADEIEEAAEQEGRSVSSWLRFHAKRVIDEGMTSPQQRTDRAPQPA